MKRTGPVRVALNPRMLVDSKLLPDAKLDKAHRILSGRDQDNTTKAPGPVRSLEEIMVRLASVERRVAYLEEQESRRPR